MAQMFFDYLQKIGFYSSLSEKIAQKSGTFRRQAKLISAKI